MIFKRQQAGRPVSAAIINQGVEAREILEGMQVAPPLELLRSKNGILLRLALATVSTFLRPALTTSTIAAGSYSSPVSATVTLLKWTGSALSTSSMPNVTAYNCWTTSSGIGSGKLVWIAKFAGQWFIVAADC